VVPGKVPNTLYIVLCNIEDIAVLSSFIDKTTRRALKNTAWQAKERIYKDLSLSLV
jgi:hypothetical protein